MRAAKRIALLALAYIALVVAFESMIGIFQPANQSTMVIATTSAEGDTTDRVVARLESDGRLYAAANHWPRAWFNQALANPNVSVALDSEGLEKNPYRAVLISGEEFERVNAAHSLPLLFRFVTGFPTRLLVRLDPTLGSSLDSSLDSSNQAPSN